MRKIVSPLAVSNSMPSVAAMSFSVSVGFRPLDDGDDRHRRRKADRGEEVRWRVETLLMSGKPVVDRILRDVEIVIGDTREIGETV